MSLLLPLLLLLQHYIKQIQGIDEMTQKSALLYYVLDETSIKPTLTGLIELRGFYPSASTSRARWSDAATSDKD